ncbi:prolyl endopeptidase [Mariannaea sp. PMI_226]|nr:prolyl endopeptidase [Mariannaea sp. PMI_226]
MSSPIAAAHLRVARPTNNIDALLKFYCDGLKFKKIGEFKDHDGFDGLILGHSGAGYHLEFTTKKGHDAGKAPTQDNLMVFYLPDKEAYHQAVLNMETAVGPAVASYNPYWDKCGKTFEDPDGYRVVLANQSWEL